ncbi:MAG: hypothetical protein BGO31_03365 [Bacteroidetes bacterium 43-16]|nr:MAG: hypothetical protein BGO31_03365 [Bacteroidetes bacterium 43-16]
MKFLDYPFVPKKWFRPHVNFGSPKPFTDKEFLKFCKSVKKQLLDKKLEWFYITHTNNRLMNKAQYDEYYLLVSNNYTDKEQRDKYLNELSRNFHSLTGIE